MKRRRFVALVSALVLVIVALAVFGVIVGVTRTSRGRERLRAVIEDQITARMRGGKLHLGRLSGNLLTEFTLDTIAIRDAEDSLFFSAGRTTIVYDRATCSTAGSPSAASSPSTRGCTSSSTRTASGTTGGCSGGGRPACSSARAPASAITS